MKKIFATIFCFILMAASTAFAEEAYKYNGPKWKYDAFTAESHLNIFEVSNKKIWILKKLYPCPAGGNDVHALMIPIKPRKDGIKFVELIMDPIVLQGQSGVIYYFRYIYKGYIWVIVNDGNGNYKFRKRIKIPKKEVPTAPQQRRLKRRPKNMI